MSMAPVGPQTENRAINAFGEGMPIDAAATRAFAGSSPVAARCRELDWAASPLGPVSGWPPALRAAARLVLDSPLAMSLWCGPAYCLVYNDAYCSVLGAKHPAALGRSGATVFAELWPAIESEFASVMAGGPAVAFDDVPFTLERLDGGAAEVGLFSYALSAVRDDDGAVLAVLSVVTETTARVRTEATLRDERERLRALILAAPAPLALLLGPEHRHEVVNDAYKRVSGGGRDVTGLTPREAFPELEGTELFEAFDRVYATGEPWSAPDTLVRYDRDGTGVRDTWFDLRFVPVRNADGAVVGILDFAFDVTEHVLARQALEQVNQQSQESAIELEMQAEELQSTAAQLEERTEDAERARGEVEYVLDTMADAYFALDATFHIIAVNGAMERGSALSRAELLGRLFWEAFPGAVGTDFERYYRGAAAGTEAHFTHDYSDGRLEMVVEVDAYPGANHGVTVFWRDISRRARAEAERERLLTASETARAQLGASEMRYRSLAEAVPVQVWTARPDGQLDFVNQRAAHYFGAPVDESLGAGWAAFVHPDDLPVALSRWTAALASGSPYEAEFRLRAADGQYRWHIARALPERDAAGTVVGWVGSNTDVEAERRARADAEAARTAAETANRAKSELLSTMSHELRTPLNAIGGYAELLTMGLRGPVTPEQREDLERIRRANQHLLSLINDILNFARIEAGRLEFHPVDLEIAGVIADVEALVRPQLAAKGLAFDHDGCGPDTPDCPHGVRADPERLRQVLLNLITNAIKFTEAGGRVSLACDVDAMAGTTRIHVRDTGRGIPESQLALIFEPFVQVDRYSSPGSQQGVGLGLAISRELARGMGGDLTVESEVGVGSTFTLSLPRPGPR